MALLDKLPMVHAIRDLRRFLSTRKRYELWFLMAAIVVTGVIMVTFFVDTSQRREYRRNIVYVQQWSANRTDAEIVAQQRIDGPKERAAKEAAAAAEEAERAKYQKLANTMEAWGF